MATRDGERRRGNLVLSRREGERVRLRTTSDGDIWITVVLVERGKVRLSIEAELGVGITREELLSQNNKGENP